MEGGKQELKLKDMLTKDTLDSSSHRLVVLQPPDLGFYFVKIMAVTGRPLSESRALLSSTRTVSSSCTSLASIEKSLNISSLNHGRMIMDSTRLQLWQ